MNNDIFIDSPQYDIVVEKDGNVYKRNEYIHNYQRGLNRPYNVGYIQDRGNGRYVYISNKTGGPTAILYPNGNMEPIQQTQQVYQNQGYGNNYYSGEIASAGYSSFTNTNSGGVVGEAIHNGGVSLSGSVAPTIDRTEDVVESREVNTGIPSTILTMMNALPLHFTLETDGIIKVSEYNNDIMNALLYKMQSNEDNVIIPIPTSYIDLYIKYVVQNGIVVYKLFNEIKKDGDMEIEQHKKVYEELVKSALVDRELSVVDIEEGSLNLNDKLLDMALDVVVDNKPLSVLSLMNTAGYYSYTKPRTGEIEIEKGMSAIVDKNNVVVNNLYRDIIANSTSLSDLLDRLEYLKEPELASINRYIAELAKETIATINPRSMVVDVNKYRAIIDTRAMLESMNSLQTKSSALAALSRLMKLGLDRLYKRLIQYNDFDIIGSYLDSVEDSVIYSGGLTEYYMGIAVRDPELLLELSEISKASDVDIFEVTDMTPVLKSIASSVFEGLISKENGEPFDILAYGDMRYVFILITKGNKYKVVKTVDNKIVIYKI